jgi:Holliday junction resolvase
MDLPYLRRREEHKIGKAGRASEKRLIKQLGGRGRPASGAMVGAKGDIDLGTVLLEAKSTTSASISVKHDWLAKIAHEARSEGKTPALSISFVGVGGGPAFHDGEWVMIPRYKFEEML